MIGRVVWRRTAEHDVVEAALYIAENDDAAGARFLNAVDETVLAAVEFPEAGRQRAFDDHALTGLRSRLVRGFENYVIFYRPTHEGIEVLRVLHGARDIDAIFRADEYAGADSKDLIQPV